MTMDTNTFKALIEAGAVKSVSIVADGSKVHALVTTGSGNSQPATTLKGKIKTWSTIDSAAKWVRSMGIGTMKLNVAKWSPEQRGML
jgi:hypothetical protein